jgi:predicted RNase H-like HicB family nuclease
MPRKVEWPDRIDGKSANLAALARTRAAKFPSTRWIRCTSHPSRRSVAANVGPMRRLGAVLARARPPGLDWHSPIVGVAACARTCARADSRPGLFWALGQRGTRGGRSPTQSKQASNGRDPVPDSAGAYGIGVRYFTANVTQAGEWFVAQCREVDITSQGTTAAEAVANLREALELFYQEEDATGTPPISKWPSRRRWQRNARPPPLPTSRPVDVDVGYAASPRDRGARGTSRVAPGPRRLAPLLDPKAPPAPRAAAHAALHRPRHCRGR